MARARPYSCDPAFFLFDAYHPYKNNNDYSTVVSKNWCQLGVGCTTRGVVDSYLQIESNADLRHYTIVVD